MDELRLKKYASKLKLTVGDNVTKQDLIDKIIRFEIHTN